MFKFRRKKLANQVIDLRSFTRPSARRLPKAQLLILVVASGLALSSLTFWLIERNFVKASIVPVAIRRSVAFPVYYPDPKKLPPNYTLDVSSFSASGEAVLYTLKYDKTKKLIFTVQAKPAIDDLATFYKNQMPIHSDVLTLAGKAAVGAIDSMLVVSLPTDDKSWVLVTGRTDIDHEKLIQVLKALRKD